MNTITERIWKVKYVYERKLRMDKTGYIYVICETWEVFDAALQKVEIMKLIPDHIRKFTLYIIGSSKDINRLKVKPDGDLSKKKRMHYTHILNKQ